MAENERNDDADTVARKTFVIATIGAGLFAGAVFLLILAQG